MSVTLYTGTSAVTFTVEIAFTTTNPLTASPTWTDVSADVRTVTTRRGRWSEQTNRYDAGTASVTLKNATRKYDPTYAAGAFFGQLVPMKQIRIRAVYSAVTYELFRGFVDGFPQGWDPHVPKYSESVVTCSDAFTFLSNVNILDPYANAVLQDAPFGFWRCGDSDNQMSDSTVNGRHGAWSGNTSLASGTSVGPVLSDGGSRLLVTGAPYTGNDITFGHSTGQAFYFGLGANVTLECWLWLSPIVDRTPTSWPSGTVGYYAPVIDSGVAVIFGQTSLYNSPGLLTLSAVSADGLDQRSLQLNFPLGKWFHLAITYVGGSGIFAVYLNGRFVSGGATFQAAAYVGQPQAGVYVENQDYTAGPATLWYVDEIAVYPSALSAARIGAHALAGLTGLNVQRSGDRVTAVLDAIGWPALRTLSAGDSWLAAGPTPSTALDYLQQISDTEQGRLYIAGDGTVVFRDRTWELETAAANTSQATFGDAGAELDYQSLVLDGGQIDSIFNSIQVTPSAGVAGIAEDSTSISAYGRHVQAISSLHYNQNDARNLARWRLAKYKDPNLNFTQLEIHPKKDPTNLFPKVLGLDFGHRVTVVRRPQGVGSAISQERAIDGIEHVITPNDWKTTYYLTQPTQTITAAGWWKVGDATNGKVGTAKVPY